jgi:aminotransferase EvaB
MNRIRMFDYQAQYATLKDEILAAVQTVLASGQLILGPEGKAFEEEFAAFLGGSGACVGVNSGTDALVVALMALGVGHGDEVITVANTAVPTVSAIRAVGAIPVFCDVEESTCLMDLTQVPGCITQKTRAVIPVHLFGNVVDVPRLKSLLAGRQIRIIEDCAQCHGATLRGAMAGTFGDISAFSFYPTKNLGAYGDAGLCWSADAALVADMRRIRMYGFEGRYYAEREGINSRLDEVQAAILRVKLRHLHGWISRRRALAALYDRHLPTAALPVRAASGVEHAYHLYVVKVARRDDVREELRQRDVETGIHYPFPIHRMKAYEFLGCREGRFPVTERLSQCILSLPMYPELPPECVEMVCFELGHVLALEAKA